MSNLSYFLYWITCTVKLGYSAVRGTIGFTSLYP